MSVLEILIVIELSYLAFKLIMDWWKTICYEI